jgi:hypothetical protein
VNVDRVVQAIVVLGLIGILAMFTAWSGDGQETTRHTLEGLAQIHLGVLILLLYVTLARVPTREPADSEPIARVTPTA